MALLTPATIDDALAALADRPGAQVLAGGTDFMVEVNFGHRRPDDVVSLGRVSELRRWRVEGETIRLGAGVTCTQLMQPALAGHLPALAQAARTVGSPQIRNAASIGGNLGTGSPAGESASGAVGARRRDRGAIGPGDTGLVDSRVLGGPEAHRARAR
jgi:CO/xanthine dehydrogenase FAD-binding subunit